MTAPLKTRGAVLTSSGSGDAGRVPLLGPDGKLDPSFFQAFGASEAGSAVAPSGGGHIAITSIVFTTPFSVAPFVTIMPTIINSTASDGYLVTWTITAHDVNGFTVKFDINAASGIGPITNISFRWLALSI